MTALRSGSYFTTQLPLALFGFFLFVHPLVYDARAQNPLAAKMGSLLVFGALISVWAVIRLGREEIRGPRPLETVFRACVAWTLLSLIWASSAEAGMDFALGLASLALMFMALAPLLGQGWIRNNILRILSWLGCGLAVWGLVQWLVPGLGYFGSLSKNSFSGRPLVGFGNPNFYASTLIPFFAISLCHAVFGVGQVLRKFNLASCTFIGLAIWASGCRSALIAVLAVGLYVILRGKVFKWTPRLLLGGFGFLLAAGLMVTQAKSDLKGQGLRAAAEFRWETWKGCFREISKKPLLGHGVGSFRVVYPRSRSLRAIRSQDQSSYETLHAHNQFLETWCEQGLIGLGLWVWLGVCVFRLRSPPGSAGFIAQAGILGFAADNLFNVTSQYSFAWIIPVTLLMLAQGEVPTMDKIPGPRLFRLGRMLMIPVVLAVAATALWQAKIRVRSELLLARAVSYSQLGQYPKAEEFYVKALQEDPHMVSAWYFAGQNSLDQGGKLELAKALERFDQVGKHRPDYVLVHYLRSKVYYLMGRMKERRMALARALALDPRLILKTPEYSRGRSLALAGEGQAATKIFRNLAVLCAQCPEALDALERVSLLNQHP